MAAKAYSEFQVILTRLSTAEACEFLFQIQEFLSNYHSKVDEASIILTEVKSRCLSLLESQAESNILQIVKCGVCHIDAFLFDEDDINIMCDKGKFSRYFCKDCGSNQIQSLELLTHSMSCNQLHYLFKYVLNEPDAITIVDIGSRTGAVLYGAYYYSDISNIIGIEMDKSYCQLQNSIVKEFSMQDRVLIKCGNFLEYLEGIKNADVVILNNVFEYFCSEDEQQQYWQTLHTNIPRNCKLITSPSLKEAFSKLCKKPNIILNKWVEQDDLKEAQNRFMKRYCPEDVDDHDHEIYQLFSYTVL